MMCRLLTIEGAEYDNRELDKILTIEGRMDYNLEKMRLTFSQGGLCTLEEGIDTVMKNIRKYEVIIFRETYKKYFTEEQIEKIIKATEL